MLERNLASSDVPVEEQQNLIKDLERKETEFMRLQRQKTCVEDFDLLTIIGRGAYGEVSSVDDMHANALSTCRVFGHQNSRFLNQASLMRRLSICSS